MKILAVNHFFEQDLDALRASNPGHELRVVHALEFANAAHRCFPQRVFVGARGYARHATPSRRFAYSLLVRRILRRLRSDFEFDLFVVPSDSIFYLREPIRQLKKAGIPTVVLQKETGMSPWALETHARVIGQCLPFTADHMIVNSELQKQFWVTAGTPPERMTITGQPRFDFWAMPTDRTAAKVSLGYDPDRKLVLFLSYRLSAYAPEEGLELWGSQRRDTEEALIAACREADAVLVIKPHPQQPVEGYRDSLAALGATLDEDVFIADNVADTKLLLVAADVIVGFQSTAMYEAVASCTPTVYAGWAPEAEQVADELLPLWEMTPAIAVAESGEHLHGLVRDLLEHPVVLSPQEARAAVAPQLGPLDGHACERVWAVLEQWGGAKQ